MELGAVVGCAEVAAEFILRTPWPRLSSLSLIRCHGRCFVGNHHTRWCLLEAAELALQRDVSGLRIHDGLSDLQSLIKFKRRLLLDSINHQGTCMNAFRAFLRITASHVYLEI